MCHYMYAASPHCLPQIAFAKMKVVYIIHIMYFFAVNKVVAVVVVCKEIVLSLKWLP